MKVNNPNITADVVWKYVCDRNIRVGDFEDILKKENIKILYLYKDTLKSLNTLQLIKIYNRLKTLR